MAKKISKIEFIERSNIIHNSKYDYSNAEYVNTTIKIKIKCKKHNIEFSQTPTSHMRGVTGCTKCSGEKTKQTNLERYGVENPFQSEDIKEKTKQTNLERYGVEYATRSDIVQEKTKQTNLERYGGVAPACSDKVKNKARQTKEEKYGDCNYNNRDAAKKTCLLRFGVEHAQQSDKVKQKIKTTNNILYGGNAPACNKEVINKMKSTCREQYGVDNIMKCDSGKSLYMESMMRSHGVKNPQYIAAVVEATRTTNKQKYGVEYFSQQHIPPESLNKLNDEKWLYKQHITNKLPGNFIANQLAVTPRTVYLRLKKFNIPIQNFYSSIVEREIVDFISLYYDEEIITNSRSIIPPYEIDIFLPALNVAIEFNGIYWHTERQGKDKNYHLNKTQLCKRKGITLIHIREDQWENKRDIVKSIILSKLNKLPNRLDARKCIIKQISATLVRNFLINNHIQGNANTSINIGLFDKDVLVSVMTFSKSRYDNNIQYELVRFASIINTNVRGAATKLFSYFKREYLPESVISYSDISRNGGNVYNYMGFNFLKKSPPGFSYIHPNKKIVESRIKYQKHKQEKILELYDESISAWENMKMNGYDRIWDCGNNVFVWREK